jgi:hypothetical protein
MSFMLSRFIVPTQLACALLLTACNPFAEKLTSICEVELKERLILPTSYSLIETHLSTNPIDVEDYKQWLIAKSKEPYADAAKIFLETDLQDIDARYSDIKAGKSPSPSRFEVTLIYDSSNSFGGIIRGKSLCEYISKDDRSSSATVLTIKLDGITHHAFIAQKSN